MGVEGCAIRVHVDWHVWYCVIVSGSGVHMHLTCYVP